jgi:hypothetical protein
VRWLTEWRADDEYAWHPAQIELHHHHEYVVEQYGRWRADRAARALRAVGEVRPPSVLARPVRQEQQFWGGLYYDGRSFVPRGTRPSDTISWFLCPLIADAAGLSHLFPSMFPRDLVPRPLLYTGERRSRRRRLTRTRLGTCGRRTPGWVGTVSWSSSAASS